jgi:hypothetical protein
MALLEVMFPAVDTSNAISVAGAVRAIYKDMFPTGDDSFVEQAFHWIQECFEGNCAGYQALNVSYHDEEHTLQGTLCLMRLLHHRHLTRGEPVLTDKMFKLALLAILLHDTGYLKRTDDLDGTGAKYTLTHVRRSADFAREFLGARGFPDADIAAVQNMIRCTGVNVDVDSIPFSSPLEKIVGFALSTADLLSQMAADDYVDKLPALFEEFAEAARHGGQQGKKTVFFNSAEELIRKTPQFWQGYVWPKINDGFGQLYRFLSDPYPDGPNEYIESVKANMARIERQWPA